MKKESKSKANSKAKSPEAKRATKTAASEKAAVKSKSAGASKGAGARAKTAPVKAKTSTAKAKTAKASTEKARTAKTQAEEHGVKPAKPKATSARTRKAKTADEASYKIGEPVLDPIGDVISGEAKTYLGEVESQGQAEVAGQGEMDAYREETDTEAEGETLEDGTGAPAVSETGAEDGADEDAAEDDAPATERPPAKLERLQKILSQAGIASRRHAEEMIVAGRVMVNGQVVTQLGSKADAGRDHIRVDGKLLKGAERHRYFVLNKPRGYVTTVSDPEGRPTVMEFFSKMGERLYPVGRLDYLSEGLLLMTNDGELANLLSKAGSGVEKVYLVKVAGQPTEDELDRLRSGIAIERGEAGSERVRTAPARIRQVRVGDNPWYEVVLTEGRNRELRKMFAAIGHFAEKIRRVGYGPLVLDVEPGKLRELAQEEVNALRLTAEGKMKPKRLRVDISLPKEAGRAAGKRGDRPWRERPSGKRFDGPRGAAARRDAKPFGQRDERGPRTEWKPREFGGAREGAGGSAERGGERPRFDKRSSGPPRTGSGFGARSSRPFAAKPGFGGAREGGTGRSAERGGERPRFDKRPSGPPRTGSGFGARPSRPFAAKPGFGGAREGGAGRSGDRRAWKPRGEGFAGKPNERPAGRFENGPRKPFRAQGAFVRPEGSFKRSDGPKKPFEGGRGAGQGAGKSFDRRSGSKARWVPRPGRGRNEEGSGTGSAPAFGGEGNQRFGGGEGAGRAKPAFGARPGGFKRPGKPGGFGKTRGEGGGGKKFGGSRPGASRGGWKRGS